MAALGKFDALHSGHRALALEAAALANRINASGKSCLVCMFSFSGMAESFGWPMRLPVVAQADRERVLQQWGGAIGMRILDFVVPFQAIRKLPPEDFVKLLHSMGIEAVVTGQDYRFGYKAAGDTLLLKRLCAERGMHASTVSLVPQDVSKQNASTTSCSDILPTTSKQTRSTAN